MAQRRSVPTWRRGCYDHAMTSTSEDHPHAERAASAADRRGGRGRLRLHPARRRMVDQQHRVRPRPRRRAVHRQLRHRTAHPGLAGGDRRHGHTIRRRPPRRRHGGVAGEVLVNTHHHGDHTNGNCLLPGRHHHRAPRCRDAIRSTGILRPDGLWEPVDWGELEPAPPFVTFERAPRHPRRRPAHRAASLRHGGAHHQ